MIVLHPTYFSPIIQYVAIAKARNIVFEVEDNYQKQTYRNRCYIYASNGKQLLNVPVQHRKGEKQKSRDVKIDYKDNWHKLHLKTLQSGYSSSPFFEFYVDDLTVLLEKNYTFLLDLNLNCHAFVMEALQLECPTTFTTSYQQETTVSDARNLAIAKTNNGYHLERYIQVFEQSHGYISNLSILDLLFMEGPNALNYLEKQKISF